MKMEESTLRIENRKIVNNTPSNLPGYCCTCTEQFIPLRTPIFSLSQLAYESDHVDEHTIRRLKEPTVVSYWLLCAERSESPADHAAALTPRTCGHGTGGAAA